MTSVVVCNTRGAWSCMLKVLLIDFLTRSIIAEIADPFDYAADYNSDYPNRDTRHGYYYASDFVNQVAQLNPPISFSKMEGKGSRVRPMRGSFRKYNKPTKNTKYVPVVVKKKKKKRKILSIDKGAFVMGGTQAFGKFTSLKACMKACYFHSNITACNTVMSHSRLTHFKKVPCTVTDAPRGRIILGANLFGTVEQKGVDDISSCLKKCANLGPGILAPLALASNALFGPPLGPDVMFHPGFEP